MPPTKPPYPPEFRREAVQLAQSTERSIAQVASDLGVSNHHTLRNWIKQADVDAGLPEALRKWVRQAEADEGKRTELLSSQGREELAQLRKDNRGLRRANEILKSAPALFAAELDPHRPK